jgi:hypothetical protein
VSARPGWIRVEVGATTRHMAPWRVRAGPACGVPGERIAAPPGPCRVSLAAEGAFPGLGFSGTLALTVMVEEGRETRIRVPLP